MLNSESARQHLYLGWPWLGVADITASENSSEFSRQLSLFSLPRRTLNEGSQVAFVTGCKATMYILKGTVWVWNCSGPLALPVVWSHPCPGGYLPSHTA